MSSTGIISKDTFSLLLINTPRLPLLESTKLILPIIPDNSRDFLYRLNYLLDGKIQNVQTDNGSEFLKYFDKACKELNINHYFSKNHTPKDNSTNERFNRTLKEEFLTQGNFHLDL